MHRSDLNGKVFVLQEIASSPTTKFPVIVISSAPEGLAKAANLSRVEMQTLGHDIGQQRQAYCNRGLDRFRFDTDSRDLLAPQLDHWID